MRPGPTMLVAGDLSVWRTVLRVALSRAGYQVQTCSDGLSAWAACCESAEKHKGRRWLPWPEPAGGSSSAPLPLCISQRQDPDGQRLPITLSQKEQPLSQAQRERV